MGGRGAKSKIYFSWILPRKTKIHIYIVGLSRFIRNEIMKKWYKLNRLVNLRIRKTEFQIVKFVSVSFLSVLIINWHINVPTSPWMKMSKWNLSDSRYDVCVFVCLCALLGYMFLVLLVHETKPHEVVSSSTYIANGKWIRGYSAYNSILNFMRNITFSQIVVYIVQHFFIQRHKNRSNENKPIRKYWMWYWI